MLRIPHWLASFPSSSSSFNLLNARRRGMAQGSTFIRAHAINQLLMNKGFTRPYLDFNP